MKKYWKLSTVILASSMLISGGAALLTNRHNTQTNNQTLLNEFSKDQQSDNVQVVNSVNDIELVNSYTSYTFAIVRDQSNGDRLYGWGLNHYGRIGTGDAEAKNVPTQITNFWGTKKITSVLLGYNCSMLVLDNKEIWVSGSNQYLQFGNSNDTNLSTTTFIKTHTFEQEISSIAIGRQNIAAISGGKLYTWGTSSNGQLGLGDVASASVPTEVLINSPGKLIKVKQGEFTVALLVENSGLTDLYLWGRNVNGYLGVGTDDIRIPTKLNFDFQSKITDVYLSSRSDKVLSFVTTESNELFAWGENDQDRLGIDSTTIPKKIENINEGIISMHGGDGYTTMLTKNGNIYSTGSNGFRTGHFVAMKTFTKIEGIPPVTKMVCSWYATIVLAENNYYAWGSAGYFGDGGAVSEKNERQIIDPFSSKPSSMSQFKIDNTVVLADLATSIYDGTTNLNMPVFNEWVKTDNFPVGTIFTMKAAPVVDNINNQLTLTVNANRSFSFPDGAKASNTEYTVVLKKTVADSAPQTSATKPWLNYYRYDNIISAMGEGVNTNQVSVKNSFDLSSFPTNATYKIDTPTISFDPATRKGTYKANLTASDYYLNNVLHTDGKTFSAVTLYDLSLQNDSKLTQKASINSEYNLTNINNRLFRSGALDNGVFGSIFDTTSFPNGTTFTATSGNVVGNEYLLSVTASQAWVDGLTKNTLKFDAKITGLVLQPDSTFAVKTDARDRFNANNIAKAINPDGNGTVNLDNLKLIANIGNFPTDNIFTILNDTVKLNTYTATLRASKYYLDGDVMISPKIYPIQVTGLTSQPDSTITSKTDAKEYFNANNIVKAINPGGNVDLNSLKLIVEIGNFPVDNIFTISNDTVTNNTYNATLSASKYYLGGNVMTGPKTYSVQVTNLISQPDSNVTMKSDAKDKFNANNIQKAINPTGSGAVSMTNLNSICNIGNFPTDNIFTISNDTVTNNTYNATLSASKYYIGGNVTTGPKTYSLQVTNLVSQPDSSISIKTDAKDRFNSNNIVHAINPDGIGNVDLDNLKLIANIGNFPTDNIFTVSNDTVANNTYNATITASKYYSGGNVTTGPKTYPIQITGLNDVVNSNVTVKENARDYFNANNIVKAINPDGNGAINLDNLLLICNIINFPTGSKLTIQDDKVESNVYSATLNTTKYYLDGELVNEKTTFGIQVAELQFRPDSSVIAKTPTPDELSEIIDKLKPGDAIDNEILGKLIDLGEFPNGTTFTIDTIISNEEESTIEFTFTPDKVYKDGNVIANSGSGAQTFDANIKFVFPVAPVDNTGLIIGLSIGGVLLLLIIIGLIIWYMKRRSGGGYSRHSRFDIHDMFSGINMMFSNMGQRLSSGMSRRPSHRNTRRSRRPRR